jgi:phosphatidylglycerol---prolipoprotein diacylglyceryl transferase
MELQSPGGIFLKLGPATIRWYGVMIALGFICASVALSIRARKWGLESEKILNCALFSFISGIVGARLYFVALSWSYFSNHWAEIAATWNGGLSIHGGIIVGTAAAAYYCWKEKQPFLKFIDLGGAVIPLAQAIGRWGNFFNSELFGRPVSPDFPLRLFIPQERRPVGYEGISFYHPTFLYESLWDLMLFLLLYYVLLDRFRNRPGVVFSLFVAGYSLGRALIEPLRMDSIMMAGFQVPFVVSLIMLALSVVASVFFFTRKTD